MIIPANRDQDRVKTEAENCRKPTNRHLNKSGFTNQLKLLTTKSPKNFKKNWKNIYENEKVRPEGEGKQTSTIISLSETGKTS